MPAVLVRPALVALIVAVPGAMPSTTPVEETVATAAASVLQIATRSPNSPPAESRDTALNCVVCPTVMLPLGGVICTLATGTGSTVTPTDALRNSLDAVIVATPGASPFTTPVMSTTATDGSFDTQNS